jgi:hypothetical protein
MAVMAAWPVLAQEPSPTPTVPPPSAGPATRPPSPIPTTLPQSGVPNGPPAIAGVCSTERDHVWRISTTELGLMYYGVAYTPSFADMQVWRVNAMLERVGDRYEVVVATDRSDGDTLEVVWSYFAGMRSAATAAERTCDPGEIPAASPAPTPITPAPPATASPTATPNAAPTVTPDASPTAAPDAGSPATPTPGDAGALEPDVLLTRVLDWLDVVFGAFAGI